jgi:lipoyl(octanoyl) transferase
VIEIERGGDVTYHGPGQIVAYPIVLLTEGERDLHRYLRNLEDAVIATLARFGLLADREPGKTGVWCGPAERRRKLCSMGIACRKWVTFHGLALNVTTDLSYFGRINPCGFESKVMSSMAEQLGAADLAETRRALAAELGAALARTA